MNNRKRYIVFWIVLFLLFPIAVTSTSLPEKPDSIPGPLWDPKIIETDTYVPGLIAISSQTYNTLWRQSADSFWFEGYNRGISKSSFLLSVVVSGLLSVIIVVFINHYKKSRKRSKP